ncbi:FimV/HubP family polar landmark protein [Thermithiobacillus plumbiphilus]|uniref:FimV/HubP family polar landmark protein n=1 Tax=Thermithiobacillus plumbiphilus TaxID=1729899 RepID=A0ABU9D6I2_9PROT
MRSKILGGLLLGAGLMAPTVSWSLGLGDMTVLSGPGEPFRAQIPLRSVTAEDLDALRVRLASPAAFDSIGVQRAPGVEQLNFRIKSGGTPVVLVSSSRPLPAGSLHFLVELEWGGGKLIKDYLARMRYPESPVASPVLPQPVITVPVAPSQAMPVQRPTVASSGNQAHAMPRHASRPAPQPIGPGQQWSRVAIYGPVTGKDNLYRIASRMRGDNGLGLSQVMAALYQHNPDAFLGGNPDVLRPGAVLKAPPLNLIQAMSDADAVRILTRREAGAAKPHARPAAPVSPAVVQPVKPEPGTRPVSAPAQVRPAAPGQPDFYISPAAATASAATAGSATVSASVQALQEENLANKKAYELLSQTVTRLNQKMGEQQKHLLELQAQSDATLRNSPDALLKNPLMLLMVGSNALLLVLVLYLLWRQRRSSRDIAAAQASLRSMEKEKVLQSREQNRTARRQKIDSQAVAIATPAAVPAVQKEAAPAQITEQVLASTESPEVDALDQAELYLTYGRVQQAQEALETALTQQPGRKEVYVKLLDLYAKQSKLDDYLDLAERMRGRFGKDNPAWRGVMAQGALLFPGNPLFEDQPVAAATPNPASGFMELDLSDNAPAAVRDSDHSFEELAAAQENSSPEPGGQEVATAGSNIIDFDLGGLEFDPASARAGSRVLKDSVVSTSEVAEFNLDLAPESGLAKAHEDVFAALDREFSALEEVVTPSSSESFTPEREEGLFLDLAPATAVAPDPASETDLTDWDGMDTKLDLAKAYVDMGDSESARELLQEIAQQGDARVRSEAQQLLAAIG